MTSSLLECCVVHIYTKNKLQNKSAIQYFYFCGNEIERIERKKKNIIIAVSIFGMKSRIKRQTRSCISDIILGNVFQPGSCIVCTLRFVTPTGDNNNKPISILHRSQQLLHFSVGWNFVVKRSICFIYFFNIFKCWCRSVQRNILFEIFSKFLCPLWKYN